MTAIVASRDYNDIAVVSKLKEPASPKEEDTPSQVTFKKVFDELFEEVKCALCLEIYDRPVILVCLHTFCASCLKELVTPNDTLSCPLCRTRIKVDEKGVAGLKTNYHLLNIVEKMRRASVKRCDECQANFVSEHCKQCKADLCSQCGQKIHSLRLLRDHVRHPVSPEDCVNNNSEEIDISPSTENPMEDDDIVVDFAVRRDACLDLFRGWESKLWFAPTDLKASSTIRQLKALFLPYWLFEVETSARYSGMSAVNIGGKVMSSWTPFGDACAGRHRHAVCATDCFEADLVAKIEPWLLDDIQSTDVHTTTRTSTTTTSSSSGGSSSSSSSSSNSERPQEDIVAVQPQRVNFHPARSCSPVTRTQALGFVINEQHAWNQGSAANAGMASTNTKKDEGVEERIRAMDRELCERKIKERLGHANVLKDLRVETLITRVAAQRVFLPVYILRYVYSGHSYIVLVNGQTGQLHGERPYSMGKMATISLTGLAGLFGLLTSK